MSSLDGLGGMGFGGRPPLTRGTPLVSEPNDGSGGPRLIGETNDLPLEETDSEFGSALSNAIRGVADRKTDVIDKVEALATGEPVDLHEVMISMGKSEVSFNLMLEVRNKLIDAWREIQRSVV